MKKTSFFHNVSTWLWIFGGKEFQNHDEWCRYNSTDTIPGLQVASSKVAKLYRKDHNEDKTNEECLKGVPRHLIPRSWCPRGRACARSGIEPPRRVTTTKRGTTPLSNMGRPRAAQLQYNNGYLLLLFITHFYQPSSLFGYP